MPTSIPSTDIDTRFSVGLDLGKAQDHTTTAVIETCGTNLHLRHLERARLGTSYPAIVKHIEALMERPELQGRADLVVDATGVGAPVVDQFREAGLEPVPVTITSGKHIRLVDGAWRVPKALLVHGLVTAFENGRLKVADGLPGAQALVRELRAFKVTITKHRRARFEGAREHDDLVICVALGDVVGEDASRGAGGPLTRSQPSRGPPTVPLTSQTRSRAAHGTRKEPHARRGQLSVRAGSLPARSFSRHFLPEQCLRLGDGVVVANPYQHPQRRALAFGRQRVNPRDSFALDR